MSLAGKVIVSIGASGGLGAGIVRRAAQDRAKTIILVGRSKTKLNKVVEDAQKAFVAHNKDTTNPPLFKSLVADLDSVQGIRDAVKDVQAAANGGGIDYLFQSQGATPNGLLKLNKEGLDTQFTVQVLSKFAFPYLLAESGTLKEAVVIICAPFSNKSLDLDDIDLQKAAAAGKYGRGLRDIGYVADMGSVSIDAITLELAQKYPQISSSHIFPGIVTGGDSFRAFPWPIPFIARNFFPMLGWLRILDTPDTVAPQFISFATEHKTGIFSGPSHTKKIEGSPWALEVGNREKLWEKLQNLMQL